VGLWLCGCREPEKHLSQFLIMSATNAFHIQVSFALATAALVTHAKPASA
jgi:hypothetical protein